MVVGPVQQIVDQLAQPGGAKRLRLHAQVAAQRRQLIELKQAGHRPAPGHVVGLQFVGGHGRSLKEAKNGTLMDADRNEFNTDITDETDSIVYPWHPSNPCWIHPRCDALSYVRCTFFLAAAFARGPRKRATHLRWCSARGAGLPTRPTRGNVSL